MFIIITSYKVNQVLISCLWFCGFSRSDDVIVSRALANKRSGLSILGWRTQNFFFKLCNSYLVFHELVTGYPLIVGIHLSKYIFFIKKVFLALRQKAETGLHRNGETEIHRGL